MYNAADISFFKIGIADLTSDDFGYHTHAKRMFPENGYFKGTGIFFKSAAMSDVVRATSRT